MKKIKHSQGDYHSVNFIFRTLSILSLLLAASQLLTGVQVASALPAITATKTDALQVDVNSNTQPDPGDTLRYTIIVQNSGDQVASAVTYNDTIDSNTTLVPGSLKTTPVARNDGPYSTVGNVQVSVNAASGVLTNDNDPDGNALPVNPITTFDGTSANGGSVTVNNDGSFTYNPAPGFSGTDTFTYTIQDADNNADQATVSISVGQVVWFINNAVGGPGDGRFTSPFSSVANYNTLAADDPGDIIFIYQGSSAYSGAFMLLNNQQLIGHGVGLTISPNLTIAAASRPAINNVTVGSGNTVHGLNISASSGTALSGASVGTLTINNLSVTNSAGAGVSISNGTVAATFDSISSNGGVNGVSLSSIAGSFVINGGTIQNATNNGINISNTSGALTAFTLLNSTLSNNASTGLRALISGTASIGKIDIGSNTFSGNLFGVDLATNDTASIDFDVHNNTLNGPRTQVNIASNDPVHNNGVGPTMEGYIRNNNITTSPTGNTYIAVWVVSDGDGNITAGINGNTINNFGDLGIDVESRGGTGDVNATITNNTATTTATFPVAGMFLRSGNGTVGETSLLCVNLSSNNMNGGIGAVADYYLDRFNPVTTLFQMQGLSPSPATPAQVGAFAASTDAAPPATAFAETGTYTAAVCSTVSFASLPASVLLAQEQDTQSSTVASSGLNVSFVSLKKGAVRIANELLSAFAVSPVQASGETVNVTLGNLDAGQQVTVKFDVTINNPLVPVSTTQVCNQGTITGSNFTSLLTDDPDVSGATDPTCTVMSDETPPDTTISTTPPNPSNDNTPAFTFNGTDNITPSGSLVFECDLDGSGFSTCTSPLTYPTQPDGSHTFQVRAVDQAGNVDASPASFTWTIDTAAPNVTINQEAGQSDPTGSSPIHFTAVFSEPVTGFDYSDITIGGAAGATTAAITEIAPNDGTTYDVAASGMTSSGTVTASIPASAAADAAGNGNAASTSTDNTVTFNMDNIAPDVTINQAVGQADPTGASPINFTAVFTEPVTGFSDTDISLSGPAGATIAVVTEVTPNNGTTFNVTVSGMTASGTVIASIPTNSATDAAGNGNTASTSTDNTVTFILDTTPPDTTIDSGPANPSISTSASFTFSGSDDITPAGNLTFECQVDGGNFSACISPQNLISLSFGSHTFAVRAIDAVGNVDPTPASFTWVIQATTSILYNGAQIVNVGSTFQPAAKLSSPSTACINNQAISFTLDVNPLGGAGPYSLGSAVTNSSGQATLGSINTTGWIEGIYTIRAEFAGTALCVLSYDEATLTVASPGNSATGGGWYTLPGSGRINFGFNVRKVDDKCNTNCAYKGNLLLMNNGKWRLKGSLDTYSKLANNQGAASGTGELYWWNQSLNGGLGDWVLAQSGVSYTINFYDSGGKGKNATDTFGINIQYVPVSPQPNSLPNSTPIQLKGGDIKVQ